jgi:hypothetical protein
VAKIFITNRDIGFVRTGMDVDVRVDLFPCGEFGDIKGKLTWNGEPKASALEVQLLDQRSSWGLFLFIFFWASYSQGEMLNG